VDAPSLSLGGGDQAPPPLPHPHPPLAAPAPADDEVVVPAFRSITAFSSSESESESTPKPQSKPVSVGTKDSTQEGGFPDKECSQKKAEETNEAEAKFQQQLQIKGMNGLKKEALKRFLSGSWKLSEDDALWVPDEDAWYCRKCSEQFSMFKRKHHCRR
jgi:hypothetical protein